MVDLIVILVLGAIVGMAGGYVYRAKKRGAKCVGCSGCCGGKCQMK